MWRAAGRVFLWTEAREEEDRGETETRWKMIARTANDFEFQIWPGRWERGSGLASLDQAPLAWKWIMHRGRCHKSG